MEGLRRIATIRATDRVACLINTKVVFEAEAG
jgi:hypothetical protein